MDRQHMLHCCVLAAIGKETNGAAATHLLFLKLCLYIPASCHVHAFERHCLVAENGLPQIIHMPQQAGLCR